MKKIESNIDLYNLFLQLDYLKFTIVDDRGGIFSAAYPNGDAKINAYDFSQMARISKDALYYSRTRQSFLPVKIFSLTTEKKKTYGMTFHGDVHRFREFDGHFVLLPIGLASEVLLINHLDYFLETKFQKFFLRLENHYDPNYLLKRDKNYFVKYNIIFVQDGKEIIAKYRSERGKVCDLSEEDIEFCQARGWSFLT